MQERVLGIGGDRVETLGGRLAGNPLARHEQAHRALAFVIQRAHLVGSFRRIDVAAAGAGTTEAAGQMAVARQRLRQRRQQGGLRLGRQVQ